MGTQPDPSAALERISAQLEDLRRLAIMQLLVMGAQSAHVARTLDVDPSAISRMMPVRDIKKAAARRKTDN